MGKSHQSKHRLTTCLPALSDCAMLALHDDV